MTPPPRVRTLKREDYPDMPAGWDTFMLVYNETVASLVDALSGGLSRADNLSSKEKVGLQFKSPAGGNSVVVCKNELTTAPRHVWIGNLRRKDLEPLTAVYSMTWKYLASNTIELTLFGLTASIDYVLTVAYE